MRPFPGAQASRLPVQSSSMAAKMAALPGLTHVKTAVNVEAGNETAVFVDTALVTLTLTYFEEQECCRDLYLRPILGVA